MSYDNDSNGSYYDSYDYESNGSYYDSDSTSYDSSTNSIDRSARERDTYDYIRDKRRDRTSTNAPYSTSYDSYDGNNTSYDARKAEDAAPYSTSSPNATSENPSSGNGSYYDSTSYSTYDTLNTPTVEKEKDGDDSTSSTSYSGSSTSSGNNNNSTSHNTLPFKRIKDLDDPQVGWHLTYIRYFFLSVGLIDKDKEIEAKTRYKDLEYLVSSKYMLIKLYSIVASIAVGLDLAVQSYMQVVSSPALQQPYQTSIRCKLSLCKRESRVSS